MGRSVWGLDSHARMKCRAVAVLAMALTACSDSNSPGLDCGEGATPECHAMSAGGLGRTYLLHVPTFYQRGTGALVIALHGVGQTAQRFARVSQLNDEADAQGFAIVYPNAAFATLSQVPEWNVYFSTSFGPHPPDDIAFLRQLVDKLKGELAPNPKKIFVVGLSNGGLMAHRVALDMGDVIAAVAVVAGAIATSRSIDALPTAANPVSVLMIHGDNDDMIPCCGLRTVATLDDSFDYWAGARGNDCAAVSTTQAMCDAVETPSSIGEKRASQCRGGTEVQFYKLFGGRHGWYQGPLDLPGQEAYNPAFNATTGITLNDIIWKWLAQHPKQ